jgi:hypothetical protein
VCGSYAPYNVFANEADGFVGPFTVTSSNSSVATGMTPGGSGTQSIGVYAHQAGNAVLTIGGYGGASTTLPVSVTTMPVTVQLNSVSGAQTFSVIVGGQWGSGRVVAPTAYPASTTTLSLYNASAVAQSINNSNPPQVTPLLTTYIEVVVSNGTINVVDKKVPISIMLGSNNPINIAIP